MLRVMSNEKSTTWKYLAQKPDSHYRQLFVRGRNISARTLYGQYLDGDDGPGRSPAQLAEDFDLPVEAVREAIAYCQSNPPELREDWEREESLVEATGMNRPDYKCRPSHRPLSPQDYARIFRK